MSRLRVGDLGDSTHSGPEDHGHVRVPCHPRDGLADSLQGQLAGWLASLTLEDEKRPDLDLPRVICEYVNVFPDGLPGLPP